MAISETKTRDRYTLDAVTTVFPITFNVVFDDNGNAKELAVYLIEDGVYTKLTRDEDYTVSVLNVTYADAVNHAGAELLIARATPLTQLIDFVTNGSYSLEQIEAMADKLTRIVQEQDTRIDDTETATAEAEKAKGYAEAAETSAGEAETSAENADLSAGSADASAEDSEAYAVGQRKGVDVPNTDPTYHRNAKYYAELCARLISGGLRYQGTWDTTGATDYSALGLPRALGDIFFVQGAGCTIDGVEYNLGDLIIINKELTDAITTADIDKIDNTETVTPDNTCPLENKTIDFRKNTIKNAPAKSLLPEYEPAFYCTKLFGSNKTTITIHKALEVAIAGVLYFLTEDTTINIEDFVSVADRKGKDVFIYACVPASGNEPDFVLSLNPSVPTGYTADNSRKIGGFHCLCANVGTISGHDLSGYVAGDVLPASRWDLFFRPDCDPEGMAYDPKSGVWFDIYLASWNGSKLVSVYGGTIADGTSSKKFHGELFSEEFKNVKKRLMWRHEFVMAARGSNEGTNISGSADPGTTGGHVDTNSRRIISNIGLEDCCGVMWQWTEDLGFAGGSAWDDSVYDANVDSIKRGQSYGTLYRLLVGALWNDGAYGGSRAAFCNGASASVSSRVGGRGACEPRVRIASEYFN